MSPFLQSFKRVHVTHISVFMFSMLLDFVTFVSVHLYINFSGGYLSTKLVYNGELLMSINTGLKVVNWVRSCIPKTMKISTNDTLSYIFFLPYSLSFIKNSIEISLKTFLLVIRPIFLMLVRTIFRWRSYFSTEKFFCWFLWNSLDVVAFFTKYCKLRQNIYVLL